MICPRDANELHTETEHGIIIDRCHACQGAWYDYEELAELEATVADDEQRVGTVEYAKHQSVLPCPSCGQTMHAFNYRAYNLELDACAEGHGFWLDAGESERVRDVMRERLRGMRRSAGAEKAWARAKGRGGGGVIDQLKALFGGRR
jgi:Zn-finger nucleic acid-binding protein